jgi:hypothetical protein
MYLIDWIQQPVMTLYIYRVGRSCPVRKSFTNLIYQDSLI